MKHLFSNAFLIKNSEEIESMTKLQKLAAMGMLGLGLAGTPAYAKGKKQNNEPKMKLEMVAKNFNAKEISSSEFKQFLKEYCETMYGDSDTQTMLAAKSECRDYLLDNFGITQEGMTRKNSGAWVQSN